MVVSTKHSADVVRARLAAWAKEWRESRLPPSVRSLGYNSWPIVEVGNGRYRYERSLGWPFRSFTGVLDITLGEDADGTFLHGKVRVTPGPEGILLFASLLVGGAIIVDSVKMGWSPNTPAIALLSVAAIAGGMLLVRPFAVTRMEEAVPEVEAMLRAALAADPGAGTH